MIAPRAIAASEPTANVPDHDSFVNIPADIGVTAGELA
jgi:hypothetical protein